mgnify:CR=1 FL=1
MASAGVYLVEGLGVQQKKMHGLTLLSRAAEMGSNCAAYRLGNCYAEGANGLPQDKAQAAYWYERVASATHNHLREDLVEQAAKRVRELRGSF